MILDTWDFVSGSVLIAATCCLGLYHMLTARKEKRAREFLFSSPDLGVCPIILSSMATFVSGILMTGFPAETYTHGITYILCSPALLMLAPLMAHMYLPVFFRMGTNTIFEYLEYRFNPSIRMIASILFTTQTILFTSVAIYAPSLALNQVTGLSFWGSVLTIGVICTLYSAMGGIKAVVWADAAQALVIIAITVLIVVKGSMDIGGLTEVWRLGSEGERMHVKFTVDDSAYYTVWTTMIGGTMHQLGFLGTNQMLMQRYLSLPNLRTAQRCFYGSNVITAAIGGLSAFAGLVMYAKYSQCDPLLDKRVTSRDQIMALFAIETLSFGKGLPGLFVAALLCATLSTLSSCLNSVSAVVMEDYVRPFYPNMTDSTVIRLSKITAVGCGILCMASVAVVQALGGVMKAVFSMVGMAGGPILAVFTVGMLVPWANVWGVSAGLVGAIGLTGWATIGGMLTHQPLPTAPMSTSGCNTSMALSLNSSTFSNVSIGDAEDGLARSVFPLYTLAPLWFTSWNCAIMLVVAPIVSLLFRSKNEGVDPELLFPVVITLIRYLPEDCQLWLGLKPSSATQDEKWMQDTTASDQKIESRCEKYVLHENGQNVKAEYKCNGTVEEMQLISKT